MKYLVWFLCFTLSFGFIELSHPNEEQPPYIPPIKLARKRDPETQLTVNENADTFRKIS